jgi:GTPase SAR1 family protein
MSNFYDGELLMQKYYLFKVLVGGNGGVGKTTLLRRYVNGMFDEGTIMTVGVDFLVKDFRLN